MKATVIRVLLFVALGCLCTATAHAGQEVYRDRLIVRLAPMPGGPTKMTTGHSGRFDFDRVAAQYQVAQVRQVIAPESAPLKKRAVAQHFGLFDFVVVTVPTGVDPESLRQALANSPDVLNVSFDPVVRAEGSAVTPNDPYFATEQYALRNTGTQPSYHPGTADADIDMDEGWQYTTGDSSTVLGIIDTGIDFGHPEFENRHWFKSVEEFDEIDNDSNGFVDDALGWNFANDNNAPQDDNGHGTHVAGIAAATGNNGMGIAGMNWACQIMAIKVLGADGSGSTEAVAAGIVYAANEGAQVISMSLGRLGAAVELESLSVRYAESLGVVVVAAMGNDNVGTTHYPAAYNGVVSVGATDPDDNRAHPFCFSPASGSNWGPWIDVCAPGDNVWSTYATIFGSYTNLCGTSMATPHVSGLVSLVLGMRPGYPADSVIRLICHAADDQVGRPTEDTPGFDVYHGWGRINAGRTLRALATAFPPIINAPAAASTTEGDTLRFLVSAFDSNFTAPILSSSPLVNTALVDSVEGNAVFTFTPDYSQEGVYNVTFIASDGALADTTVTTITVANGCQCPCHADPQCDGSPDVIDVIKTIGVAFRGEATIFDTDCFPNPGGRTDFDCNGVTDVIDVVSIINVAFRGQVPNFCNPCNL